MKAAAFSAAALVFACCAADPSNRPESPAPVESQPPDSCVDATLHLSKDGKSYYLVADVDKIENVHVRLIAYTRTKSYLIEVPSYPDGPLATDTTNGVIHLPMPTDGPLLFTFDESFPSTDSSRTCLAENTAIRADRLRVPANRTLEMTFGAARDFKAPTCDKPFAEARVTALKQPDEPLSAVAGGYVGTSVIEVALHADGSVAGTHVFHSSGYPILDDATTAAARATTFMPKVANCVPVSDHYLYATEFTR